MWGLTHINLFLGIVNLWVTSLQIMRTENIILLRGPADLHLHLNQSELEYFKEGSRRIVVVPG